MELIFQNVNVAIFKLKIKENKVGIIPIRA
jgi:hypothetical protein